MNSNHFTEDGECRSLFASPDYLIYYSSTKSLIVERLMILKLREKNFEKAILHCQTLQESPENVRAMRDIPWY